MISWFKISLLSEKRFQKYGNSFISWTIQTFISRCLEICEKAECQICFGERSFNDDRISIVLQTKNFPRRRHIHLHVDFPKDVDLTMTPIISLKIKIQNLKFSLNLVFLTVLIA